MAKLLEELDSDAGAAATIRVDPSRMRCIGSVDERFQSYNVEMVEVIGGRFWKPYSAIADMAAQDEQTPDTTEPGSQSTPTGMNPDLYMYRPPINLANSRLRAMARALAPAYMRVSGTWANTTFFDPGDTPVLNPPEGYGAVLTRDQWLGVIEFSKFVDAPIVTSMPVGKGTRDAQGEWLPDQARRWLAFTRSNGGTIAAVEFFNEPTLAAMGGAPDDYSAADYGRDHRSFERMMREDQPDSLILAPGSVGEADADWSIASGGYGGFELLLAEDLTVHTGAADAFSYHHYGAVSRRCLPMGHQTTLEDALSEDWLGRTDQTLNYYRRVRDRFMPGKVFWNTETAEAAGGANPWAKSFLDTFRYIDQLGRLARQEVAVVIHNTLAASDYGLLDEDTFLPRPNFWAALLWRRIMGTTVLDPGVANGPGLHVYAHSLHGVSGGVAMVIVNTDRQQERSLDLTCAATRYTLTATNLLDEDVKLNDTILRLAEDDALPAMRGRDEPAGRVNFPAASITFLAMSEAANEACG